MNPLISIASVIVAGFVVGLASIRLGVGQAHFFRPHSLIHPLLR